jgi:type I restriction-modification system DNA methylase subunit
MMKSIPELKKDFIKTMNKLSYSRHLWQTWQDFNELSAIAIQQSTHFTDDRGERYMSIVGRYEADEVKLLPHLFGITTAALEVQMCDFLGDIFQELELASKWHGQFFTPYPICKMMASMTLDTKPFAEGGIVSISEPACGGGAMLIAACDHLRENDINYQRQLKITAVDVDLTACHMAYIQLSLLGCNAVVVHGNTLSVEGWGHFETPMCRLFPIASPAIEVKLPAQRSITDFQLIELALSNRI